MLTQVSVPSTVRPRSFLCSLLPFAPWERLCVPALSLAASSPLTSVELGLREIPMQVSLLLVAIAPAGKGRACSCMLQVHMWTTDPIHAPPSCHAHPRLHLRGILGHVLASTSLHFGTSPWKAVILALWSGNSIDQSICRILPPVYFLRGWFPGIPFPLP